MKLKVLIPSAEYRNYAGARIRYGRLAPQLERHGISIVLEDVAGYSPNEDDADVLLISKCHDAKALVAATAAHARRRLVGVDLFDDYFSQTGDSRLGRYRLWLRQLLRSCDFALGSTAAMAEVIKSYAPGLPTHVMNDPAPNSRAQDVPEILAAKLAKARNELTLRIAWFGVGDNPHFRVGLSDLAAFTDALRELSASGMDVELVVLTNARALTAEGLALIGRVPVHTSVEEWSEAREGELLSQSFACFLPVNAQHFSAAKSLNRAITALSAGCQVISAGYPLYEQLDRLIYRDTGSFLSDLARGQMKHSIARLDEYQMAIEAIASAEHEAARLAAFLHGVQPSQAANDVAVALVHGQSMSGAAHKAIRAVHGLSVGTPYCRDDLTFDVTFRPSRDRLVMLVSDESAKRVLPAVRPSLLPARRIRERKFWIIPEAGEDNASDSLDEAPSRAASLPLQLATYSVIMARICQRLEETFGPCRVLISESSPLPFSAML